MQENTISTHNKGIVCKPFGNFEVTTDGNVEIDYSGKIVLMSKETESKIYGKINTLTTDNKKLNDLNVQLKKKNLHQKNQIEELRKINAELEAKVNRYITLYNQVNEELKKFKDNQAKGRASKLTNEMKGAIELALMKGYSITAIYEAFAKKGIDISYETIRRYCAEIRAKNVNIR